MTLHQKTLIIIATTVAILLLLLVGITRFTILHDFSELETAQARDRLQRSQAVLASMVDDLMVLVTEWVHSYEITRFTETDDFELIKANMADDMFMEMRTGLMAFVDPAGEVGCQKAFDLQASREMPVSTAWAEHIRSIPGLIERAGQRSVQGILPSPSGPLMIAACAIPRSERSGRSVGTLIMGRLIDRDQMDKLQRLLQAPLVLYPLDQPACSPRVAAARAALDSGAPIFTDPSDDGTLAAFTRVPDLHGRPALLLQTNLARRLHRQGRAVERTLVSSIVIAGSALGAMILLLLHRQILARVAGLAQSARRIAAERDLDSRVPVSANDELTRLAESINEMLGALSASGRALRERERIFRAVFDQTFQYTCLMRPDGTVIDASTSIRDEMGDLMDQMLGRVLWEAPLAETSSQQRLIHEATKRAATGQCVRLQAEVVSPQRGPIPIDLSIKPIQDESGEVTLLLTEGHDLTDHKQAEHELRRAKDEAEAANRELESAIARANELAHVAEAANAAKSEFLASISHELRTPLHGILSFSAFGIKKYASATPEKLLDYFRMIQQSGDTLLTLLNDLLDLAKLEAGRMTFDFRLTSVEELIQTVMDEFRSLVAERGLTVALETHQVSALVRLDPDRIRQVLRNLLGNAVRFSSDGGRIDVQASCGPDGLRISVRDQGSGVPEDELHTIFDKFVQSSRTRSGAGGTGLGLAICQEITAAHGGRIWAENNSEAGAAFSFELPLSPPGRVREPQDEILVFAAGCDRK